MRIVWNDTKTFGIIVNLPDDSDEKQMCYELRKGSSNSLGLIDHEFQEAWNSMTAFHNCDVVDLHDAKTHKASWLEGVGKAGEGDGQIGYWEHERHALEKFLDLLS